MFINNITLVGCGILAKEVEFLIADNNWPVKCSFACSSLHVAYDKLRNSLEGNLEKFKNEAPVVFYGTCHPLMQDILNKYGTRRTKGQNCIEMLLGSEMFQQELKNGAFFLLEDWAYSWKKVFTLSLGEDPSLWTEIINDQHKYILAIRTPCSEDFSSGARAFSCTVELPLRWLDVTLDHLKIVLQQVLFKIEGYTDNDRKQ